MNDSRNEHELTYLEVFNPGWVAEVLELAEEAAEEVLQPAA